VPAILSDLEWLGLDWDGEPVFQSARLDSYARAGERLKAMGLLYPCHCTRA
jgi:glutamyl-Q tRNA(Asp) synthetase